MIIETAEQREIVREAGKRLGTILGILQSELKAGMSTAAVDARAEELIRAGGDLPVFKGYQPDGAPYPFPGTLCISINDEVVHGIPES